ncbi:SIR2 family protein [Halomonas daqingensis]|uniref:SIR2 family NAD-dependent protein deacylase n=1 Tax=Billgrantia desiderata TaxID=52021 RepID=UPI001F172289|nr:SIR2 family protein [Halomonas desiderata]MCE8027697.1 SIR2 family protein [Halomonas desiderata]
MSEFFEIAYAAATNRLCLFTGTGFSKAISDNEAPSWQGLLEDLCDLLPHPEEIKDLLFPEDRTQQLSLEEAAQVISIKLSAIGKNIHEEIAELIEDVDLDDDIEDIEEFFSNKSFRVVTTNYDKLAEELTGENSCQSITPGRPIPRSSANVKIYHVHGSVDSPENMVVTSEDYFRFINSDTYFSRKLSTVLHENTVVILGYSLGDTNLKAIISDYKGFSKNHVIGSNIFLVSRSNVDQHVKDYYSHCYGIRVLDGLNTERFFRKLNNKIPKVARITDRSLRSIRKVVHEGFHFKEAFLKLDDSFYRIISSLSAERLSLNDARVVEMLGDVIESKRELTLENNAWEQYEHLAGWLVYLASLMEIRGTSMENKFLEATLRSMNTMRKEYYIGYSWHAYKVWKKRWPTVIASNRTLIKNHIEDNTDWSDALVVVNSIES